MSADSAQIFISYSRKDRAYLDQLLPHLAPLEKAYRVRPWVDTSIPTGSSWREEIRSAMDAATVGVLLVSPDFLASSFVTQVELPKILAAADRGSLSICVVHVRPSVYQHVPAIDRLQAVNDPKAPISSFRGGKRDAAWASIAVRIVDAARRSSGGMSDSSAAFQEYARVAEKLGRFCLEALDLKSSFQFLGEGALDSEADHTEVTAAVNAYNQIVQDLLPRRAEYFHAVAKLVPPAIAEELQQVLDFALDDVHRNYAFQLNEVRIRILRLHRNEIPKRNVSRYRKETRDMMQPLVRGLADKVPILERRTQRLFERIRAL